LKKYYNLLLAVIRVINSAVLSKGSQNQHTIEQARRFLAENRYQIVAMFKRHAKIGGAHTDASGDLEDIVESFTLLISMTKFLEVNMDSWSGFQSIANSEDFCSLRRKPSYERALQKFLRRSRGFSLNGKSAYGIAQLETKKFKVHNHQT
jgi:hypothetical protein